MKWNRDECWRMKNITEKDWTESFSEGMVASNLSTRMKTSSSKKKTKGQVGAKSGKRKGKLPGAMVADSSQPAIANSIGRDANWNEGRKNSPGNSPDLHIPA